MMRTDMAMKTKKGLSFILASVPVWTAILIVWLWPIEDILTRNLLTFFCVAPLLPLAFFISKLIKAEFGVQSNPLNSLGLLFSLNQVLYILIPMWAFNAYPERMVMILAMIFGAHLLPFGWLYLSKSYTLFSIVIPVVVLFVGSNLHPEEIFIIPALMILLEILFIASLLFEYRQLIDKEKMVKKKSIGRR